jgi:hypothetical protein
MKQINLKIDGKEHIAKIPENWNEVTVDHYQKLIKIDRLQWLTSFDKDVAIISTFIGVDKEIIELMELNEFNSLIETLAFLKSDNIEYPPLADSIELGGKEWFIKKDFDKMVVGERITLDVFISGKNSPDTELDLFLTLFIKETPDETWKNDHKSRRDIFKELPFVSVKPIMDFFLIGMLSPKKDMKHSSEDPNQTTEKSEKEDLKEEQK